MHFARSKHFGRLYSFVFVKVFFVSFTVIRNFGDKRTQQRLARAGCFARGLFVRRWRAVRLATPALEGFIIGLSERTVFGQMADNRSQSGVHDTFSTFCGVTPPHASVKSISVNREDEVINYFTLACG